VALGELWVDPGLQAGDKSLKYQGRIQPLRDAQDLIGIFLTEDNRNLRIENWTPRVSRWVRLFWMKPCLRAILGTSGLPMRTAVFYFAASVTAPSERVTRLRPRKHLRSLPTRTRPSLFGSD
jgi:hypothetical protein